MNATLTAQPQSGQSPALGMDATAVVTSQFAPLLAPGDIVTIDIAAPGAAGHLVNVGFQLPGDSPRYAGTLDPSGNLTFSTRYGGPGLATLTQAPGLLLFTGFFPNGPGLMGEQACMFLPAPAPPVAMAPGSAALEAAIEQSWQTHVPVVDPYNPATWAPGSYQSTSPISNTVQTVNYPTGAWEGISLASGPAQTLANLLGGTVQMQAPEQADYNTYYADPYRVEGSLTQAAYIYAQMPIGPGGSVVAAKANAGNLANATLYRTAPGGIHQAILNCFRAA